jgi:acetyltransferase
LAIVTNGGGVGVLATDALIAQGGELATLSDNTMTRLNEVLPPTWSHGNPIDIIGDADAARYGAVLQVLAPCADADAVLVLNCPVAVASSIDAAKMVIAGTRTLSKPLLANWLGARAVEESRPLFEDAGIPNYETPEKAVRGFMHLARYHSLQATLQEVPAAVPDSFHPDRTKARKIIEASLRTETKWLDPQAITDLFAAYDIPIARTAIVNTPDEAARMAGAISAPVALKIFSRDLTHKSDVGGVMLDLNGADAVRATAEAMLARVAKAAPNARLDGFIVQEMIRRPHAYELIVGMAQDVTFGPFLLFGHGGTAVEVIDDKALGLPPLNMKLAREMMQRTRIWRQLKGYRDRAAVATDSIASTLVKISQLISDFAEIAELDINPLLADETGVIVVDARIRIAMPAPASAETRMAIRPYPQELEEHVEIPQAGAFFMRPVRPEDAEAFVRLAGRVSPSDLHMRFFSLFRNVPLPLLVRLTQIDYDREMAFVLFDKDKDVAGVGRLVAEPDGTRAEFAVLVRTDLKAHGIGWALMTKLINYARHRGIAELFGEILVENEAMLGLAHSLGFKIFPSSQGVARATLTL